MSPIACDVDDDGTVVVSTRETAMKVEAPARAIRERRVCVLNDGFFGEWVQVDGTAEVVSPARGDGRPRRLLPAASSGEHPDWDEYRAAMERDRRVLVRITVERAGPNVARAEPPLSAARFRPPHERSADDASTGRRRTTTSSPHAARAVPAGGVRAHRHEDRLRHVVVRRVHRASTASR